MALAITGDLDFDLNYLKKAFGPSVDFYLHRTTICGADCAAVLCDDVSGLEKAWELLLRPLQETPLEFDDGHALMEYLKQHSALVFSANELTDLEDARYALTAGNCVFFVENAACALVFSTQEYAQRSVSEPDSEVNIYGSKEAFCDVLRKNMGLIRRRLRADGLVIETMKIGQYTGTEVAIIYQRELVSKQMLHTVKQKLKQIRLQMVFDSSYLAPFWRVPHLRCFQGQEQPNARIRFAPKCAKEKLQF